MKKALAIPLVLFTFLPMSARADFAVEVSGITSGEGFIRALVFEKAEGFPEDRAKAVQEVSVKASTAKDGKLVLKFKGVEAPEGVVSVIHDQDGNGVLRKNLLGIPKEPVAVTGWDGKGRPKFDKCISKLAGTLQVAFRLP